MSSPIEELIFTAASAFADAKERAAFLEHACQGDANLRKRLDELLDIEAAADTFFDFQPEARPADAPASTAKGEEEALGARIGRYRLVSRIGAGGCGVVYHSEQEEPVKRKVALKIVKLGMDTEAVMARFELERQALAQMDHPNIARVLDAGATASGRPYFVMELVEGDRITDFCDTHQFPIRRRLELFAQVCRAIQHAHQKGVIHRDIKPSNVLVRWHDGVPVPKVIDFGIAKAAAGGTRPHATVTRFDQFIGTPDYMSPEQARGGADVDTRSDIYSLGVLLYELLTGRTPFAFKQLTDNALDEVRRIIQEEEPKPPSLALKAATPGELARIAKSRRVDTAHLPSQLAGDLDWIVMMAMAKELSRRYDTATGVSMDVTRYLNNEPVLARPPSRAYLLRKLVQRNKLVFAAASIAGIGLLAGFGTSTWMYFRERAARQEQARLREKAELREDIAHAAVKLKYRDFTGADALLAKVPAEETPSSLEAAQTFEAVADWHMQAWRLQQAASRYTSMIRALASVDNSDIPAISTNLLPAAATVAYASGAEAYEQVRRMALARFGSTTNGAVAEQTIKACLLMPADKDVLQTLAPLAGFLEQADASGRLAKDSNTQLTAWMFFTLSLMHYRAGEYPKAAEWAERCLAFRNVKNDARRATTLILRAMIAQKMGDPAKARASLGEGRTIIDSVFANGTWIKASPPVIFWWDWLDAAVLLGEAERLVGGK